MAGEGVGGSVGELEMAAWLQQVDDADDDVKKWSGLFEALIRIDTRFGSSMSQLQTSCSPTPSRSTLRKPPRNSCYRSSCIAFVIHFLKKVENESMKRNVKIQSIKSSLNQCTIG